eukprot:CAMPEP_0181387676 /NCGR_PEP_ID=MMETSP1106-20121128/23861_1 /TAXON_ID=81844 /ORGANISM="Mantoniella antarctica, Strain SL-175" /LENGTH=157 /DNA_ID=CAMNT_0023508101 /DNA_START=180 /DNA_END=649 /DNA_ORIENTATION=+
MTSAQVVDRDWFSAIAPVEVLEGRCEPLIAGNFPGGYSKYLEDLRAASSLGSPCTTVWMAGSVAYRCRTCQTGEQSSVCVACFKGGKHRDHDYIMYRSETGGVCDCGDLESWAESGCCEVHAPRPKNAADQSASKTLPRGQRRDAAEAVIGVVAERL